MGTDVYLLWDKQTRAQKKKQYTGYSINAGGVGYLRASIGMEKENAILRELFPHEVWHSRQRRGEPYDFKQCWIVLQALAKKYLASCLFGMPIAKGSTQIEQEAWFKNVDEYLAREFKFDKTLVGSLDNSLPSAVMWLNSLYQFIGLGIDKQEKGLKPRVLISW